MYYIYILADTTSGNGKLIGYLNATLCVDDARSRVLTVDSTYCDLENIAEKKAAFVKAQLCVLHLNIHSLPSKFCELKNLVSTLGDNGIKIHVIMLCETFLVDTNCHMYQIPGYTFLHNSRKSLSRGGVAMYILDELSFSERFDLNDFQEGVFECIFAEIRGKSGNRNTIIGEIYRPPNTNEKDSIARYDNVISRICSTNADVILGTDQNFDYMKINSNNNVSDLFDVFYTQGLLPTATRPTRITHATATLIDNVYVKANRFGDTQSMLLMSDISDHLPVLVGVGKNSARTIKESLTFTHRPLSEENTRKIANDIQNVNWDELDTHQNVNDSYAIFMEQFSRILDQHASTKTVTIPYRSIIHEPWMTPGLLTSCKTRNKLYRKCINQDKGHKSYIKYVRFRSHLDRLKKISKETHYNNLLETHKNNISKTWNVMNGIIRRTKNNSSLSSTFLVNDRDETNELVIANSFCDYFTGIQHVSAICAELSGR